MNKAVRMVSKILSIIVALGIFTCALILGAAVYFNAPPEKPPEPAEDAMRFDEAGDLFLEVRSGETAYSVGKRLENAGVIRSRYLWDFLFRIGKEYIKAGSYSIGLPATQTEIRSVLVSGDQLLVRVTIPEGVTLKKTAQILEDSGICAAKEFIDAASSREILDNYRVPGSTMEGYLYPDTYLFNLGFPPARVIGAMADTFFDHLGEISPEAAAAFKKGGNEFFSIKEINDRVIIASIVEREYRVPDEAALMAGVFFNRLKIGMGLQSCATVEYVITEIQERPHPEVLYNRDLEIRDPYNTYIWAGLPPGPISAPGETALRAAFYPAQSDYLYFRLMDPRDGKHYFSKTLDDHIQAGALYTKGK